jgi:Stress responsive A/B Barrel Domain
MVIEVVLFKWNEESSDAVVNRVLAAIRSLKPRVNGIVGIFGGRNFSPSPEGFTHTVVVVARTREALSAYHKHPAYEKIARRIQTIKEKLVSADFEYQ